MENKPKLLARGVEYYPGDGTLLLITCPKCGRENWAPNVADGVCAWCGYNARDDYQQCIEQYTREIDLLRSNPENTAQ